MDEHARQAALDLITVEDAVQLTRALVDIPSTTGYERPCAVFLHDFMRDAGVDVQLQEIAEGRANVVATLRGEGSGPTLMLNGHIDTSGVGEMADDYPGLGVLTPNDYARSFEVERGIYGLGAFNMKGGDAANFLALRALKRAGVRLPGHVLASGVAGESEKAPVQGAMRTYEGAKYRGSGYGTRYLLMHCEPIDYAIIAEPSDLYVVNAQAGYLFVKIVVWGRAGFLSVRGSQSSGPAVNALDEAIEVVRAIRDWAPGYTERHTYDSGLGTLEPQVTVGAIDGGWPYKPSYAPGVCHLYVNIRTTPDMTGPQALAELDDCLKALAAERSTLRYDLEVYCSNVPSTVTPVDSVLCRTAIEVMEQRLGFPTRPFGRGEGNPSNDTNIFRRHGIPAIKCGPKTRTEANGREMMIEHGAHVYPNDIVASARFNIHMAFELSGRTRAEIASLG